MPRKTKSVFSASKQKQIAKIAKKVAHSIPEVKTFGFQNENIELFHNKAYYGGNWLGCTQGTEDPNDLATGLVRIGDEIYLKSVNIRLWLSNKEDRPNVMYKAYLFWYASGATINDSMVYFTQQNKMLDRINTESISIIDSQTIFSGPQYMDKEHSYLCTLKGSWKNKKITYFEKGETPKFKTIGLAVVAYDAFGTLQTDNIASIAYNANIRITDP